MKKEYLIEITWFDVFAKSTATRIFYNQCQPSEIKAFATSKIDWYKRLSGTKDVKGLVKEIIETKPISLE